MLRDAANAVTTLTVIGDTLVVRWWRLKARRLRAKAHGQYAVRWKQATHGIHCLSELPAKADSPLRHPRLTHPFIKTLAQGQEDRVVTWSKVAEFGNGESGIDSLPDGTGLPRFNSTARER